MAEARGTGERRRRSPTALRYTIDASVFVNAFNRHERGHAQSLETLTALQERGDPIIVPTLLVAEVASAIARTTGDRTVALQYARAVAALPHMTLVSLTPAAGRRAAELAAAHRLRGADAVYLAVAQRYASILISRDEEQLTRGSRVAECRTPEQTLKS